MEHVSVLKKQKVHHLPTRTMQTSTTQVHLQELRSMQISSGLSANGSDCGGHWLTKGIATLDDKLYCAPGSRGEVLVIDLVLETLDTIPTGHTGLCMWTGIAALDGKLYCAPANADVVLVDVAGIIDERALLDAVGV